MNAQTPVIPLHLHPLGFIEAFTQLGANLDALLRHTRIDKNTLNSRDILISYAQQRQLIVNGMALCPQPGLGLLVGRQFDWAYYGTVGAAVQCSPSLRDAGEAFLRYQMILQPFYGQHVRKPNVYLDTNNLLVHPLRCFPSPDSNAAQQQFELEFRLAVTLRLWDACGNKAVNDPAVHIGLQYPEPAHVDIYRLLPCSSLRFNCKQSYLAAHLDFVAQPFRLLRKPIFDRVLEQCEEELQRANSQTSCEAKVRWHLHARFAKQVSLEQVAQILALTPRTLTRRLADEHTSFRQLLHDVRMEIAAHHLRYSRLCVDKVAELVGFSCAASLQRAMRHWSNVKPAVPPSHAGTTLGGMRTVLKTAACLLPSAIIFQLTD
jgi:AraC-like DNA-binding protein